MQSTMMGEELNAHFTIPIANQKETRSFHFPLPLGLTSNRQTNGFFLQWPLLISGKVVIGMERMRERMVTFMLLFYQNYSQPLDLIFFFFFFLKKKEPLLKNNLDLIQKKLEKVQFWKWVQAHITTCAQAQQRHDRAHSHLCPSKQCQSAAPQEQYCMLKCDPAHIVCNRAYSVDLAP